MMDYEKSYQESEKRRKLWGIGWPGHPDASLNGETEISLNQEPERWSLLECFGDPNACYSYDDIALMKRDDGLYALVRTSGCSCPSPTETWGVICEGSIDDLKKLADKELAEWGGNIAELHGPWIDCYPFIRDMELEDE